MHDLQHYIRYGAPTDKKYFQEYKQFASTVVLNANTICHHSANNAEFIHIDLNEKDYIIDPRTYAYQMDIKYLTSSKSEKIKQTYEDLLSLYKLPSNLLENINPINKENINILDEENFVQNVLDFQENFLYENLDDDLKLLIDMSKKRKTPKYLISPYFFLDKDFDFWLELNHKLIKESLALKGHYNKKIYSILLISKEVLKNEMLMSKIIDIYSLTDGLLFWINDFKEHNVSDTEINSLIHFISKFREKNKNKEIISLYGGYFTQLLYHCGLNAVCHNISYGESRNLSPTGSAPTNKYYLAPIKQKIDPFDIVKILANHKLKTKEEFYNKICDCKVCKKNINTDKINENFIVYLHDKDKDKKLELSRDNCTRHYLECKVREFKNIPTKNLSDIIKELNTIYEIYKKEDYLKNTTKVTIEYIKRWNNVLQNFLMS